MHSLALRAGIADQPRSQRCAHGALMIRTKSLSFPFYRFFLDYHKETTYILFLIINLFVIMKILSR
jgi:hypothetical protein